MGEAAGSNWWIIIPVVLAILALLFSLEKRASRDKKAFPQDYIDGLKAIAAGDDNTAFVKLKQAVAADTDNIDGYLKLGDLFRKRGQLDKAIQVHRELLIRRNLKQAVVSDIRQSLVEDYIQADKLESALEILEILVKDSSYKVRAFEKMLEVYEKLQQWDEAIYVCKGLAKSKTLQKKLAVYKFLLGKDLFDEGEFHKARLALKESLHIDTSFAPAYIMIAESYLAENRPDDAAEFFKKLAENAPSEVYRVISRMEETLFELGRFSEVEIIYNDILKAAPDDNRILTALAGIAEKKGDIKSAIDTLAPVMNSENKSISAITRLTELYLHDNQKNQALAILKSMPQNWPADSRLYRCSYCNHEEADQIIVCQNCKRVGPYKKI